MRVFTLLSIALLLGCTKINNPTNPLTELAQNTSTTTPSNPAESLEEITVGRSNSTGVIAQFDVDNTHSQSYAQFMIVRVLVPVEKGKYLPGQLINWSLEIPALPGVLIPGYAEVVRSTFHPGTSNRRDALFIRFESLAYIEKGKAEVFKIHETPLISPKPFVLHSRLVGAVASGLLGNYPRIQVKIKGDPKIYEARLNQVRPISIYNNNSTRAGIRWTMELIEPKGTKLNGLLASVLIEFQTRSPNFEMVISFGAGRLEEPVEKVDVEWAKVITEDLFRIRFRDGSQSAVGSPSLIGNEEHHMLLDSTKYAAFLGDGQWVSFRGVGGINIDLTNDPYGQAQMAAAKARGDIGVIQYKHYRKVYTNRFANDILAGMPYLPTRQFTDIANVRNQLRRTLPVAPGTPFSYKGYISQNPPGAGLQSGMMGALGLPDFIQKAIQAETPEPIRNLDFALLPEALRGNLYMMKDSNGIIRRATVFDFPNMAMWNSRIHDDCSHIRGANLQYFQMRTVRGCGPSGGYQFYEANNGTWRGYDNQHVYLFALIYYYLFTGDLWAMEQLDHHGTVLAWNFYTEDPNRGTGFLSSTGSERGRRTDIAFASIAATLDGTPIAQAIRTYLQDKFVKTYRPKVNTYMNAFGNVAILDTFRAPAASCAICNQNPNSNFIIGWQRPHSEAAFCLANIYGMGGLTAFNLMVDYNNSTANQFGFDPITGEPVAYAEVSYPALRAMASEEGFSQQVWADAACSMELLRDLKPTEYAFWTNVVYPRLKGYFQNSHGRTSNKPYELTVWGKFNSQAEWISNPNMDY